MAKKIQRHFTILFALTIFMNIVVCTPSALAESMGENLIKNFDFSKGMEHWTPNSATVSIEKDEVYQGIPSMKVTKNANYSRVDTKVTMRRGNRYLLAVNIRMASGTATANITIQHQEGPVIYEHLSLNNIDENWKTIKFLYTSTSVVPEEIATLYIRLNEDKGTGQTYYFNNFRCIALDTAPTAQAAGESQQKNTAEFRSEIYVDPVNGSDSGAGTKDSPYKTIEKARDVVRTFNKDMKEDITVYLRGGNYEISRPIELNRSDSGTNGHKVIWKAYKGEKPFIRGPRVITGWTLHDPSRNIYAAPAGKPIETRQLYVNGERAVRARSTGGLSNATTDSGEFGHTTTDTFLARWKNVSDMEMVYAQNWTLTRVGVDSITLGDDGLAHIKMKQPAWKSATNKGQTSVKLPWYYENAYELLDEPGEWYLDRSTYTFYYIPRAGEDITKAEVVAPEIEQLMSISGDGFASPVENIEFNGVSFGYSTYLRPSGKYGNVDAQNNHIRDSEHSGDWLPPASIMVRYAHGITFERCEFSKIGHNALQLIDGIQNCVVNGNKFYDISSSAVNLGEPYTNDINNYNPSEDMYFIKNNKITNNYIYNVACEFMSAAAISAGFPRDTVIEHNEIAHVPYSGMHIGYGWNSIPTSAIKNLHIRYNYIHDIFYTKLYDGGGIYTIGPTSGTMEEPNYIAYNYITDMNNDGGPVYNDQGSTYYSSYKNVIDQSRAREWVSGRPKWYKGWGKDISFCSCVDNYTNISHIVRDGGDNNVIKGTKYCPTSEWPEEAQEIIRQAGLEPAYRDLADYPQEISVSQKIITMRSGETQKCDLSVFTSKREAFDLSKAQLIYQSRNPEIASVSENGVIQALSQGKTVIDIMVRYKEITLRDRVTVIIDDVAKKINVVAEKNAVFLGDTLKISAEGETAFGNKIAVTGASYTSDRPDIASVDNSGVIRGNAEGSTVIRVNADIEGRRFNAEFPIRVVSYTSSVPTNYTPYKIDSLIDDVDGWNIQGSGTKTSGPGWITFDTPGGSANYKNKIFANEIFDFNLKIDNKGGWPSIQFRGTSDNKTMNDGGNSGYIIVIKETEIELQRFNSGVRRVFFGNIDGSVSIGGKAYPNDVLKYGETAHVQCGAINESNGVRLILNINGKRVFDFLDTDDNRVTSPGYFGIVSRNGTMTLSKADSSADSLVSKPVLESGSQGKTPLEGVYQSIIDKYKPVRQSVPVQQGVTEAGQGFSDIQGHWAENDILSMYQAGMIKGKSATAFVPDDNITNLEFLTIIFRWMKDKTDMIWSKHSSSWGTPNDQQKVKARQALYKSVIDSAGTDNWREMVIKTSLSEGLLDDSLLADGDYDLDADITREEMAAIVYKAYDRMVLEYIVGRGTNFADKAEIAPWAADYVRMVDVLGYMKGDENGRFHPKNKATRAEAAAVIKRMYDTVEIR